MRSRSGFRAGSGGHFAHFLKNLRGRIPTPYRHRYNFSTSRFDLLSAHNLIARPIVALNQYVGKQFCDDFTRGVRIKDNHRVNAFHCCQDFGPLLLRPNMFPLAFQPSYAGVTVQPNDEHVAISPRLFEDANVPRMQYLETAIGEDDPSAVAFLAAKPQNRFLKCQHCRIQRVSMRDGKHKSDTGKELVYHAQAVRRPRPSGGR